MDMPAVLIKITGGVLFLLTMRSIYKHAKEKKARRGQNQQVQSVSEQFLNGFLLYLWLTFMTVFSLGMIFNN
ncbi:MAG: hypothetical protein ACLFVQ_00635 [Chitinispirillaceae bacterium]